MTVRTKLYIGLLALVVVMVGGSLWFLFNATPVIDIPEGKPIIAAESSYTLGAQDRDRLFIYENGMVVFVEDEWYRPTMSKTRTWNVGQLEKVELDNIILLFQSDNFTALEDSYKWPPPSRVFNYIVSIDYQGITKTVTVTGYPTPDEGLTYPDMPYPLNEIYQELKQVIDNTEEVYSEPIQS
ncbi:MAG: hypothetical protein Q8O55_10285 [Dehalococcoidales bacterium]|nr:hypothetical protein [Dehalococcoidales bacterium]